jgi:hypothetical protein
MICLFENWAQVRLGTKKTLLLCAALFFVYSIAIYSRSLQNEFVWDTVGVILEDSTIQDLGNVPDFFSGPLVVGKEGDIGDGVTTRNIQYYRPLLTTLHAAEFAVFGDTPLGYKAVSLLLNGLVVVLGFLVVRQITGNLGVAFLAALIYASVSARAEAVYWVYSDSHILSALFSLAAFWAYLKGRSLLGILLFITGLLFQEGGFLLPLILLAYEGTRRSNEPFRARCIGVVPFGLVSTAYLVARHFIVGKAPTSPLDTWSLLKAAGYQTWEHIRIFFMTDSSATVYLYEKGMFSPGGSASVSGVCALLFFGIVTFLLWRFRRDDFFWYLWFLIWIVLAFNVGSYGGYLMAEKTLYLASLGLSVLLVRIFLSLGRLQPVGLVILCGFFVFNSTQIYARAESWTDTATYVAKVLDFEPEFDLALMTGGRVAYSDGRYEDSASYYLQALRLRPDLATFFGNLYVESVLRWAQKLTESGEAAQAIQVLEDAAVIIPGNSKIYNGMGNVYYLSGDRDMARRSWGLALQFDPADLESRQNLRLLDNSR